MTDARLAFLLLGDKKLGWRRDRRLVFPILFHRNQGIETRFMGLRIIEIIYMLIFLPLI